MIIAGGTAKQLGVLSKKKIDERKGREERILAIGFVSTLGHIWSTFSSPFYTYYISFSKLGNSGVQRFKRCPNRSWNEKVMVITRKLFRAERKFRTVRIKVRKFSHRAKHPHSTRVAFCTTQTNFHRGRNNLQKFFLQRNNFQKWGNLWNNFRKGESTCKNPSNLQKSKIQIRMATIPGAKWFRTVRTTPLPHECHHLK